MPISREELEAYLRLNRYGKPITIRRFQRLMGYKSPGQAERMLKKLERLGLIERVSSSEFIAKKDLPPELSQFIIVGGYILPRAVIYTVYSLTSVITYILLANPPIHLIVLLMALIAPYLVEIFSALDLLKKLRRSE